MAIDRSKLQRMHKLMADNGYTQDYNTFEKKFTGDSNYANRKAVYDLFTKNGADLGGSYEEFMRKLQKPRATKPQQQPKTALGRAQQSVAQQKWGGYGGAVTPMENDSELVRGLKNADAAQRLQAPVSYAKPGAVKQMVKQTRERQHVVGQNVEQAGRQFTNRERDRRNAPAFDLGNEDVNNSLVKTRGQLEDELEESSRQLVNNQLGGYVTKSIEDMFKDAEARGLAAATTVRSFTPYADIAAGKVYNEALDPDKLMGQLSKNAEKDMAGLFSDPKMQKEIIEKAASFGIDPEDYVKSYIAPGLQTKIAEEFEKSELSRNMPKSTTEYIIRGVTESMVGTILSMGIMSKKQRQYAQQGMAMTDEGENPDVDPNMGARVARGTLSFVADTPVFGAAGKAGATVAGKMFGNGVAQTTRIANAGLRGRIARMAGSGMVSQGVTGVLYGSTNAAVQNYSTGDDTSIGNTVKLMTMGGVSEGASWATMGGIGGVVGGSLYNVSGLKRIPAKVFQVAMEGWGMHVGGNVAKMIEGHDTDFWSVEGTLEACANVVALKLTHAKLPKRAEKDGKKESYLGMVARNLYNLTVSDRQRAALGGYTFTNEEKEQLFGSKYAPKPTEEFSWFTPEGVLKRENLTHWAMRAKQEKAKVKGEGFYNGKDVELVNTAYDEIMADTTIPWDTKAKFSALVMGTVPSARPMMDHIAIERDERGAYVGEYSLYGELLSKNRYKTADEYVSIKYNLGAKKENQRLSNAYGAAQIKDEKAAQETLETVAETFGFTAEQMKTAMDKDPLRRSEEEQNACVALRKAYEGEQFPEGTLHPDQSQTEGKDVVEENNLGTENPNNEAVAEVLNKMNNAEKAFNAALESNDVLKQEYERLTKEGFSEPQIYMELFNSGMTQEQLAPFADYINAKAKAVGMYRGTEQKIAETVQKHVEQWSYKGELNGEKQVGSQMLFVKDNNGRLLIVGAGDVAFDNEGRARENVGDMLSVLDPATMEMDFISKKDVQLDHVENTEDYTKNYQTKLEVKNSEAYTMTQEQIQQLASDIVNDNKSGLTVGGGNGLKLPQGVLNNIMQHNQNMMQQQAERDKQNTNTNIPITNEQFEMVDPELAWRAILSQAGGNVDLAKKLIKSVIADKKATLTKAKRASLRKGATIEEKLVIEQQHQAAIEEAQRKLEHWQNMLPKEDVEQPTPSYNVAKELKGKIGSSLSEEEATNLVGEMESRAKEAHDMPLTPENWEAEFGEDGKVQTPLGEVKMGENQLVKLFERGRSKEFGMIKPTLSDPDVVIEVPSEAKDGKAERDTSLLFIKTFKKPNGEKVYYFKSVTIKKDGIEISISSHYDRKKRVEEALKNGKLLYLKQGDAQTEQSQLPASGTTFREIIAGLNGKDSNNSTNGNENNETLTFADGSPVPMKKDSKGRYTADYSQMTPEQGAEWIKTRFGENADGFVDGRIKRAEKAVKDAKKIEVDLSGEEEDVAEALAARKTAIENAEKELAYFTMVKNVMKQTEAKEKAGGEGATGNRYEQWRKDGYHIGEGGVRYDRQKKEDMKGVYGREVKVDFTPMVSVNGRAKVVEVDSLQASHVNGQVNPMHFGPDWQPKDRTDDASKAGQDQALKNFDPEKITGDGNAFIGSAPSVNERHEGIQGNNRIEILRRLYDEQPEKAAQYKQWLIDHAEEFGYDPAEIAKMERPVLVNELPVDDAKALELGQYRASDFESGGKEIPRTSVVINRLGDKMQSVANIMLSQGTLPDDAKMSDLVAQNASKVLDYLVKEGVVSVTEEQTLRKDKTAMRQWMEDLLKTGLFEGDKETEAAFNQLPDNARRAVLATYLRDAKSGDEAKIKQNLQHSFEAYVQMMNIPAFVNAKNIDEARAAIRAEIENGNISLLEEEAVREKYSNFELELAALYKGLKDQKTLTGLLNKYFDAVQGDKATGKQLEIGQEPREAISKDEAIKEVFGLHDAKPAETQNQVDKAVKNIATEITKKTGIEVVTDEKEAEEVIRESEETDSELKYHKETDEATLEELENGETVKVYRAMQVIDGKLYPPMAAAVNGKRVEANELGVWIRADENPDLAIPDIDPKTKEQKVDKKTGELKWKFKLDKGGKDATGKKATDIPAAYNPYWHTSRSPLNDQFKSAWIRPNIVVVECEVPVSELSSGYRAERAKDAVGEVDWKSGVVSGEVYKQTGRARKVILSRWCKPVRVLSDAEVAQRAKEFVGDAKVEIPENVLTPKQRIEFEKAGFKIGAPEKGVKKSDQINEALKRGLQIDNSVKEFRTKDGEVYGFTDGKKIYLDTKKMKPETPLHEYTHLWCDMLRRVNPKEWENVKKLFDKVEGLKEEVKKLYPELEGDALYEEMITTYSGREGTKKLEDVVRKLAAEEGKSVTESAKAQGFLAKVKEALTKYWKGVADVLGIHFTTAEEVADKVLADWAKGENPLDILPKKEEKTFDPIGKAAENYKKDHPLTEGEIRSSDVDDIAKDMAVDYLNGEVTDDLHRAVYESIYERVKDAKMKNVTKQADNKTETTETPKVEASASPIEGMKNAAEKFAKEKEATAEAMGEVKKPQQKADDAAVEASNKKVNDLWNDLLKAGREDLSASFIGLNARQLEVLPKLVSAMAENAYLRIKRGMHNLEDVVKEMRKEFAPAAQVFKKEDVDAIYEQMMNIRYRDGEQRMSLKEWADYYEKSSPKHQENLVGDSKEAEDRKISEKKFIDKVNLRLGFGRKFNGIVELRKMAEECGLKDVKDTDLQELAETAIVQRARGIACSESYNDARKFELIKKLYENQPSLNQRDSERVMKQQYSTPAPYAFLADMYVKAGMEVKSALEPSAGNGMLTIGLPKDAVHVNDIDAQRLANLQRQGFKNITSQDGTQPFADKDVDVVVTNPPFGSATPRDYDGYTISTLEGQMAINALESMKDNGRAAIIIGGKTEYAKNGSLNPKDKALLGYLYSHYKVEDVINVDGSLYAKQGTTYPTRIILINGRRYDENAYPPVKDKARAEAVKSYDELYKRINDDILQSKGMDSPVGNGGEDANAKPNRPSVANTNEERVRAAGNGESEQKPSVRTGGVHDKTAEPVSDNVLGTEGGTKPEENGGLPDGATGANGAGAEPTSSKEPATGANEQRGNESGGNGRPNTQSNADGATNTGDGGRPRGQLQRVDQPVRELSAEKVTYAPRSENPFTLKAVMPADQQESVNKNLEKLGDADQFLVEELGYNDKEDLYSHLAAEQVDSVALALQQAKQGNAFIIGDMTGIGKGRQAASLIRYAKKQGQVPVYFTKTAGLLSDVYRDLVDIGSNDLRPFVFGSAKEAAITDADGNVVFALPSKNEVKRVLDYIEKNGELPKEYDYVLTTYSQVSNGVYEFDENGNRKERKLAKGKNFGAAAISGQARRDAIEKLMKNGYLILDESHTAGGDSGQGNYFQHIIQKAKNVTFFSATFAKRPDNMPIYALRTAMNQGGLKASDLIDAVKRGGATLQEIMSQALTQCGQMIRRERDMTGVTIDWKAIDDPEVVAKQREQYDSIIGLFNDIINFQRTYVSAYVDRRNEELAKVQSSMGIKRGTEALGIKNQPFASKAFNTVQQVLLSLKAKSAAERAIEYLKQGMKPVIALNNTNESQTGNLALGEEMDAPDLGTSLKKGLEGTLRYTSKNAKDESNSGYINLKDLGADAVEAYHALEEKIRKTSTGLSLSPIDVIKNELTKAGYKVGELTGRQTEFVYNENGTVTKVKRADTDKKKLAREFNDGQIDALILNKSAATGISLHASSKYADQRKRVMIVAQQQLDVNDEVQMRGRIDRTGQVARGAYEYVVSLIPAEQRLLMMFKAKLKSLDANTTSSQKSKFNEMEVADITNKYGDKVVKEYMAEHLDLYARMADPFGWEKSYGADLSTVDPQKLVASSDGMNSEAGGDASKLLGRMALLKVKEQEKMLQEIGDLYAAEIQRLNEMGENDLEITELPLKAKTINKGIWKEGSEPGGNNAFADNTYVEKVNMAVLKKPMKAEEVKKAQDGLTGGKSWDEYRKEKITAAKEYFDNKIAEATQKYEERAVKAATKAKEKYIKDAKKAQKETGMSDEQIEKMAGYQYESIYSDEKAKLDEVVKNLKSKYGVFERALETFNTEDAFVLPTDMNNPAELSGFGNSYGRLIDIKITDNFSPNASTISFATLDGRRKITFPINGNVGYGSEKADVIGIIDRLTRQASAMGDNHLRVLSMDASNWDKLTSNESRKDGYIITGNLLQALIDTKEQGLGGQLVKYTTDTGEVKTGILMPEKFEPKGLANEKPINSVADKFELPSNKGGITEITSSDGDVKIEQGFDYIKMTRNYTIRVPKSNKKGGKYFLDKELLKMVDGGNFETRGNTMLAEVKADKLKDVLDRLSELGVKVKEESKVHYRMELGSGRVVPEDVDKKTSEGIEKKFDEEIGEIEKRISESQRKLFEEQVANNFEDFSKMSRNEILNDLYGKELDVRRLERSGEAGDTGDYFSNERIRYECAKAAARREFEYRDVRRRAIEDTYGLRPGTSLTFADIERTFRRNNREAEKEQLFEQAVSVVKKLGIDFGVGDEGPNGSSGVATIDREIALFVDGLTKTATRHKDDISNTILHEMLHQATMGAIHLVNSGKAEGVLTQKQIDAVNTIIDIYHKVKDDVKRFEEDTYGLQNEYEFAAQMGNSVQRKALDMFETIKAAFRKKGDSDSRNLWQRFKDAIKTLIFGNSDKSKMDKAIEDIIGDFNDNVHEMAMDDVRRNDWAMSVVTPKGDVRERIEKTVEKVAKRTGGKVKMVYSVEEIDNPKVRKDIEKGKQVTGWYDEKTGEVHLYMPNIHDTYTAEKTVWHETVGHKGMRGLLGDKFDSYMRDLWMDLDNPINAELRAYVKEKMNMNHLGFYDAIEEFIAKSAEDGKGEPGFWNYIKNRMTDALHEIGYRVSPNVKDVKYMLWLAKNVQKHGDSPLWKMRAEAVRWKIEHEKTEYTKIEGGELYDNDGKSHDFENMSREEWLEATDGEIHYRTAPSAATALDRYHHALDRHSYMATEAFMDNMLSLKKLMEAIDPSIKKIEDVASSMNPYLMQNITEGKMSDKSKLFEIRYMDPLSKAMSSVLDSFDGKKVEDRIRNFNMYMIRKHGLERNRVLFVRDWFKKMENTEDADSEGLDNLDKAWKGEKYDLRKKLDSGQIDLKEYYRQMDEWIVTNLDKDFKAEEHDYSGMHGLQGIADKKSPYDDAGAIDEVMSQEASMENMKKGSVADFWKKVKAATDYSVNSDYESGLISQITHDGVLDMFDWYVPLRKFDEATAEDVYGYVTEMGDPSNYIGTTLMNAKGRKSLSNVEILAQIGLMGNRAIRNGGQNTIKQAFARFVRNSGEQNLVKETKVWVEKIGTDRNGNDIWEEAYPKIPEGASADDVASIVDAFETDMRTKQAKGEAKSLSNSTDIGFKFQRAKDKSQHFVDVKIAGRTHRFVVLGNPRAAQALNGMLENGKASQKWLQTVTRWMAMASTSWSPEFVMRNIVRDAEFASSHVRAKEGGRYAKKWARYYGELNPLNVFYNEGAGRLKSMKMKDFKNGVGFGLYARYREGTLGNSKMERYFKEFMENGGETGFVQLFSMHDMEKSYKSIVEKESAKGAKKVMVNAVEVLKNLGKNVESLNEVAENMARFATYCTSRDLGRSAARSAYDAKEVSTNFNRHGSGDEIKSFKNGEMSGWQKTRRNTYGFVAGYLRNYSMFFNAGIQSTNLLFKNIKRAPVGTAVAMTSAPFALALIMAAVNNAIIQNEDDKDRGNVKDPYGELPDYIRRNNLCIYVGNNKFVTVPLAIELRAFYSLGDLAAGQTFAKNVKSQRNMAMDAVGCMSQLFPVMDFLNNPNYEKSLENGVGMTIEGLAPTAIVPFIEWWLNNDWKGAPIRRTGDKTELNPAWQNAYNNVPARLVDLNKWVNAKTNNIAPGNPEMKGNDALDWITDPSMLNHFYSSWSGGMGTFVQRTAGLGAKATTGKADEIEVGDVPFLRSLFYTPREQSSMARTKAKWYNYKEEMEQTIANNDKLKSKNVPTMKRIENAAALEKFEGSPEQRKVNIIKNAEKRMRHWNTMRKKWADDKKQVDFANHNIEMIMQEAVEDLDRIE